jgi:hypothetical protein
VILADKVSDEHHGVLTRRLQAINDGEGNHIKYLLEELYIQQAILGPK